MDSSTLYAAVAATAAAAVVIPLALWTRSKRRENDSFSKTFKAVAPTSVSPRTTIASNNDHNETTDDVWAERRRRGIAAASSHGVKIDAKTGKPFASSYYYAHNNSGTTGGYKDGLTMEDFAMNGPRLLSRHRVGDNGEVKSSSSAEDGIQESLSPTTPAVAVSPPTPQPTKPRKKRCLPISKYLWDDPGDSSGIATIRIDSVPASTTGSAATIPWSAFRSSIASLTTSKIGTNGAELSIVTSTDVDYALRIPEFYGTVVECKAVSKAKRLLIKVHKQKGMLHRSNTNTWPHPQKKAL